MFSLNNNEILDKFSYFSNLGVIFYSMFTGVKKSMDLWIDDEKILDFINFCKEYNIFLKYDIKFVEDISYSYNNLIGKETLTTTKVLGVNYNSKVSGKIHCFLSMKKSNLINIYKYGWYPVITGNRLIYKSYHDLIEFGKYLGYPKCCINYFYEKNDWRYYNFLYEIYLNSTIYDYRCNSFWKDYGISYIYHMPCSFSCKNTIKYVDKVIYNLKSSNPGIIKHIEEKLLLPILSIREQKVYAFEGVVSDDKKSINYSNFYHLGKKSEGDLSMYLKVGNLIKIEKNFINIYYYNNLIFSYDCLKSSEIEKPFIIKFDKY